MVVSRIFRDIESNWMKFAGLPVYDGLIPAAGNPAVTVLIALLPDGRVESVNLRKTSGYPNFDESVRQGILRASPLPKKNDGTVERRIEVRFFMKRVAGR